MSELSGGVYVDDAGTPGTESMSRYLHRDRKSWAAVIIPPNMEGPLQEPLRIFLEGIWQDHKATELHFTDIYGGRGQFKGVDLKYRFELIDLMASIFFKFEIPIIYQTSSPELLRELKDKYDLTSVDTGWFNFTRHEHFSLLMLLSRVAKFVREHRTYFPTELRLVVDEGIAKKGAAVKLPGFRDIFENQQMHFQSSIECVHLQLADFAAFAIARSQWLQARGQLRDHDVEFLKMVSPERLNIINLPVFSTDPSKITTENYDALIEEDRLFKGFKDSEIDNGDSGER